MFLIRLLSGLAVAGVVAAGTSCSNNDNIVGTFKNEKGNFALSWCYPSADEVQLTLTLAGTTFIAVGFGGSMYDADMVAGWVDGSGKAVIGDYYSSEEAEPKTDESLGGSNDIKIISGSKTETSTTLVFSRKLVTGDKYDRDISTTEPMDMIYAWSNNGEGKITYHDDNHNHVFIDFSKADGIPATLFGFEESGGLSRTLVRDQYYGTLSTMQTEAAGGADVKNFPYGSIADFADKGDGTPIILLSDLERNVINVKSFPSCSLSIAQAPNTTIDCQHPEKYDVMTQPRTTLLGHLSEITDPDALAAAKDIYVQKHPKSKAWINFSDFTMYYFVIEDVYAVGGFGNDHYIGWISPSQYSSVVL